MYTHGYKSLLFPSVPDPLGTKFGNPELSTKQNGKVEARQTLVVYGILSNCRYALWK